MLFLLGILLIAGGIWCLVGWIWTVVIAFMNEEYGWGIASLICGIAALVYAGMDMSCLKDSIDPDGHSVTPLSGKPC
ncbi:MAG: hypothetical protein R3B96_07695 [Pirellulaceae bacterium]